VPSGLTSSPFSFGAANEDVSLYINGLLTRKDFHFSHAEIYPFPALLQVYILEHYTRKDFIFIYLILTTQQEIEIYLMDQTNGMFNGICACFWC
jgi:hypothetical protein